MNARVSRLANALHQAGVAGVVVQHPVTMGYLVDFAEDGHERFLGLFVGADGRVALVAPRLSQTQATRSGLTDGAFWADGEDPMASLAALRLGWESKPVLVDDALRAAHLLSLQAAWPDARFAPGGDVLGELMRCKDEGELALMSKAAVIADEAWEEVKATIRAGETEAMLARRLASAMEQRGGKPKFAIVATGGMGAEPHHLSDLTVIQTGDVLLCDFGCEVEGYQSDITRVVSVGRPSDHEAESVYSVVLEAHLAAVRTARPGATRHEVDQAARAVIAAAGYGDQFTHRLGHGIGRNAHEEPNLTPGDHRTLQIGDCFSIEPGVYLPGRFGVRLENIYTLTAEAARSLNAPICPQLDQAGG